MLVLSRLRDESVVIQAGSERVVVTVCDIRGDKVRLGIQAAKHVTIHRQEVQAEIDEAKKRAAAGLRGGTEGGAR